MVRSENKYLMLGIWVFDFVQRDGKGRERGRTTYNPKSKVVKRLRGIDPYAPGTAPERPAAKLARRRSSA